jgi:hypothetical protein
MTKIRQVVDTIWVKFQESFIGMLGTVIFGLFVMFITGVYDRLSQISDTTKGMIALEKRFDKLEAKLEERDKAALLALMQSNSATSKLEGQILVFQGQHTQITDELKETRHVFDALKRAR